MSFVPSISHTLKFGAVVGRVERFAIELFSEDGDAVVRFVTHHPAGAMLEGNLATFAVEGVAIAVIRGLAKRGDLVVVLQPAELHVIR
jgi:hypothetical protein